MSNKTLNAIYMAGLRAVLECEREGRAMSHITFQGGYCWRLDKPTL